MRCIHYRPFGACKRRLAPRLNGWSIGWHARF